MKRFTALLPFFILVSMACFAQNPPSNGQNAVASSQIRVRIAPYAIINLGPNNSTAISYHSPVQLKNFIKLNPEIKIEGNTEWSVNVITDNSYASHSARNVSNAAPSYTVVYVTTRI